MPENSIAPETVREQLRVILDSRAFITALRARRFLTHIVEETLGGRTDGIKELVLGIEVFDRPRDFDPKVDTVVRVEAGKLRKRLEEYYANEGAAATLRIEVPKGGYVPQFRLHQSPAALEPSAGAHLHRFPGGIVAAPVIAALVITTLLISALAWWAIRHSRPLEPAAAPSIAVLPFLNLSADPAGEYFTDGLTEEITDALCNAGELRVAARTSAFFFKGRPSDVHEIGSKLHVAFVVEGSVRKQGEQLRVTAQLIRTDDGYHVWSGSFERRLADVFAVQREIAGSVVAALQVKLTGAQTRRLKKTHNADRQAFDLYLQGKHLLNSFAPDSVDRAEALFQQSIARDPAYALPYVGLAEVYELDDIWSKQPGNELAAKGTAAIRKALALDDELAEAYVMLGSITARHEYDWAAAERHLRHALELNPSSAVAHHGLAHDVFAPQGRWKEALAESRMASELDPLSPMIAVSEPWLAFLEGRSETAVDEFRRLTAANPNDTMALYGLSFALTKQKNYPAALAMLERLNRMTPSAATLAFMGWVQARMGNTAETQKILRQLLAESQKRFVSPVCFAVIYMGLGDAENVFHYLETARAQHESALIFLRTDNAWDPIRRDPRYLALLTRIGLLDQQSLKNQAGKLVDHR